MRRHAVPVERWDDSGEPWTDFAGRELAPDRFWNSSMDEMISADDEGPCMGIEMNIWERAMVGILFIIFLLMHIISIISIMSCLLVLVFASVVLFRYDVT